MRKLINYFFLILGLVYIISGLMLLFQGDAQTSYSVFFGIEMSKLGYVIYKTLVGAVLMTISIVDLRQGGSSGS